MRSPFVRRLMIIAAATTALVAGCGPFGYLGKVAKDASRAVADAEKAGAEQYAPYEYWGAVTYLEQAKVLMAYSEYERSFDYGTRAKQLAEEAKAKADRRESGNTKETLEEPAPAGDAPAGSGAADSSATAGDGAAKGSVNVGIGGGK